MKDSQLLAYSEILADDKLCKYSDGEAFVKNQAAIEYLVKKGLFEKRKKTVTNAEGKNRQQRAVIKKEWLKYLATQEEMRNSAETKSLSGSALDDQIKREKLIALKIKNRDALQVAFREYDKALVPIIEDFCTSFIDLKNRMNFSKEQIDTWNHILSQSLTRLETKSIEQGKFLLKTVEDGLKNISASTK